MADPNWLALWNGLVTGCLALAAVGFVVLVAYIAWNLSTGALDEDGDLTDWPEDEDDDADEPRTRPVNVVNLQSRRKSQVNE